MVKNCYWLSTCQSKRKVLGEEEQQKLLRSDHGPHSLCPSLLVLGEVEQWE